MRIAIASIFPLLVPALAIASPQQCRVPDGPAESAEPSSEPAPPLSDASTGKSGILVPVDAKPASVSPASADSPMLKHLAQSGAQLSELGTGHGMRSVIVRQGDQFMVLALAPDGQAAVAGLEAELSVEQLKQAVGDRMTPVGTQHGVTGFFVRNGAQFQVFYATPDGERLIPGIMWDATGHNVTRDQIATIAGTIPTVEIAADGDGAGGVPAQAPSPTHTTDLSAVQEAAFGLSGDPTAPRLWMFIDPECPFSIRAMAQLQPLIDAKKIRLAVIPLAVIDYENQGKSTKDALALLSKPADRMVQTWRAGDLHGDSAPAAADKLRTNMKIAGMVGLRGTPTLVWQKSDGTEGRVDGLPANLDAILSSIGG
jgi:thiol:disulfide interchange protein DsbG